MRALIPLMLALAVGCAGSSGPFSYLGGQGELTEISGPKITVEMDEGAVSDVKCETDGAVLCQVRTMLGEGISEPFKELVGPVLQKIVDLIPGA